MEVQAGNDSVLSIRVDGKHVVLVGAQISPFPTLDMSVTKRKYGATIVPTGWLFGTRGSRRTARPATARRWLLRSHFGVITGRHLVDIRSRFGNPDISDEPQLALPFQAGQLLTSESVAG